MPWPRSSTLLVAALLLAGCTTLRVYPGAPRDATQVARLRPAVMPARLILLDAVDGQPLDWLQDRAEVLPGTHTAQVTAVLRGRERELEFTQELAFAAEPGRDYVVYAELGPEGPRVFILDDGSGNLVAEAVSAPIRSGERSVLRR